MNIECPECTFEPVADLLKVLTKVANGDVNALTQYQATVAIEAWIKSLATAAQIAMVETNDDLEIDDQGACIAEADDGTGFFIQTWTWVQA